MKLNRIHIRKRNGVYRIENINTGKVRYHTDMGKGRRMLRSGKIHGFDKAIALYDKYHGI